MAGRGSVHITREEAADALARMPLFAGCRPDDLREVARCAHVLAFAGGQIIVPEGEEGLGFYVILSGRVRVERDGAPVAALGANEFFGEIALLEGEPRTASVVSDGGTVCLGILRSDFKPLLVRNPRVALRILEEEERRRRSGRPMA